VVSGVASAWDRMQAWSAQRSAAYESFKAQNDTLTASLGGTVDAFSAMMGGGSSSSSTFISNEALSSSLFGGLSTIQAAEETIVAQAVYSRIMKQQEAQLSQIVELQSALDALA